MIENEHKHNKEKKKDESESIKIKVTDELFEIIEKKEHTSHSRTHASSGEEEKKCGGLLQKIHPSHIENSSREEEEDNEDIKDEGVHTEDEKNGLKEIIQEETLVDCKEEENKCENNKEATCVLEEKNGLVCSHQNRRGASSEKSENSRKYGGGDSGAPS